MVNNLELLDCAVDERGIVTLIQQPGRQFVSPFGGVEKVLSVTPYEHAHPLGAGGFEAFQFLLRIEVRADRAFGFITVGRKFACGLDSDGNAYPRTGALHALQGLLAGSWLPIQAKPSGRAAGHEDFRE